jgi:hypothetical protein
MPKEFQPDSNVAYVIETDIASWVITKNMPANGSVRVSVTEAGNTAVVNLVKEWSHLRGASNFEVFGKKCVKIPIHILMTATDEAEDVVHHMWKSLGVYGPPTTKKERRYKNYFQELESSVNENGESITVEEKEDEEEEDDDDEDDDDDDVEEDDKENDETEENDDEPPTLSQLRLKQAQQETEEMVKRYNNRPGIPESHEPIIYKVLFRFTRFYILICFLPGH